ncbi:MAG TPA: extracellular solute-binding protein [bacterium]|nr:extracellular solute-binding protein [bacterium]
MDKQSPKGMSRRAFVKTASAAAAGVTLGYFGGKAPAMAQEHQLHSLQLSSFVSATDETLKQIAAEFGKQAGVKMNMEFIGLNDVLPRAIAAVESRTGPDLILLQWNQGYLFGKSFVDMGDVVQAVGGKKIYLFNRQAVHVNGVYRGVPHYNVGSAMVYNKPMWDEAGINEYPDTYEGLLRDGTKLKKLGYPIGWTLGHTIGDGAFGNYPLLWAFGGYERDAKGRVAINSKGTRAACDFMREFWNAACDEGGMAWNDSSNNQAFLGETISCCLNAASIYMKARRDKNPIADKIRHTVAQKGPAGRFELIQQYNYHVPAYSKNVSLAKEWLRFLLRHDNYERFFVSSGGFAQGISAEWEHHKLWDQDPVMKPYSELSKYGRNMGYKAAYDRASSEVQAKYIVADLFVRAIKDGTNSAIKWAEGELKQVYKA